MASRAACSAATVAANGVDFFDPLKPALPDDPHDTALPCVSVMVMVVLLNVALMCATPVWMFFRTFFFCLPLTLLIFDLSDYFFVTAPIFFTAMRRGPLRVRALVWVR